MAALVEVVGEKVGGEELRHLVKPHQTTNFQLLWSEEQKKEQIVFKFEEELV